MRLRYVLMLVAWAVFLSLLVASVFGQLPADEGPPRADVVVVGDGQEACP